MHCESQLAVIKNMPPERRILHVDSSGGLCKITNKMNDQYQQLMNYVFLIKDASDLDNIPGVMVNEVITSRQDTCRIGEMFHLLKHNFSKVFDTALSFRFVVLDLSWATIHAVLEVMNLETVEDYAHRVFDYATGKGRNLKKSFLSSCSGHTMHRFTRALKKKRVVFFDLECKTFSVCCFSLLLNSVDLKSSKDIFELMCIVFLSEWEEEDVMRTRQALQALIELRPNDTTEIKKCIKQFYSQPLIQETDEKKIDEEEDQDQDHDETSQILHHLHKFL